MCPRLSSGLMSLQTLIVIPTELEALCRPLIFRLAVTRVHRRFSQVVVSALFILHREGFLHLLVTFYFCLSWSFRLYIHVLMVWAWIFIKKRNSEYPAPNTDCVIQVHFIYFTLLVALLLPSLHSQEQQAQANISNICTGLDILCFLLTMLPSTAILAHFKPLQRGIAACMTCGNTKVLRAVHSLLSRLMSNFPTEPSK